MTETGFTKAQSNNLPKLDPFMVARFFSNSEMFSAAEIRGVKLDRASRENYGDSAVGYVQLKREGDICTVKGKMCPEHRVRGKNYNVSLEVDENTEEIKSLLCHDCAASLGGCKHAVAFLMWIYRKSEEPSRTDIECYWKKSKLASIGTTLKFITVEQMKGVPSQPLPVPSNGQFLRNVIEQGLKQGSSSLLLKYAGGKRNISSLSLHYLLRQFLKEGQHTPAEFLEFCKGKVSAAMCEEACLSSTDQCNSKLWHELRYGRITASRIYEVARCKTAAGTLTESIVGSLKIKETEAMKRGKMLENKVRQQLEKQLQCKLSSAGLLIVQDFPHIGASPDAISEHFVFEIKCPVSIKTVSAYIKDNKLSPKCNAQIQLQMHVFKKRKGIFCVADPGFETNEKIHIYEVDYDQECIDTLINAAHVFWCANIFPLLVNALSK